MKTEVIIAVRGELPENLKRTAHAAGQEAPVVIVEDGAETDPVEFPKEDQAPIKVYRPWSQPRGPGQARHYGIFLSTADIVILTDGHMTFPQGWVAQIEKHLEKKQNAQDLVCCRTRMLDNHFEPLDAEILNGAFLAMFSREVCGEYWAISAKWNSPDPQAGNRHEKPHPVPAIMGACYALRREWYEKIGQPLSILEAWGGDEEILSLATHIMGGRVMLLHITCGHIYMAPSVNRIRTADEHDMQWSNKQAVIDVMPGTDEEKKELTAWLKQTRRYSSKIDHCFTPDRLQAMEGLSNRLRYGKLKWADLVQRKIIRRLTDTEQAACLKSQNRSDDDLRNNLAIKTATHSQVIQRKAVTCERCGGVDTFRQTVGLRQSQGIGITYARCKICGHKAQIRILR